MKTSLNLSNAPNLCLDLVALKVALDVKLTPKFDSFDIDSARQEWSKEVFFLQPLVEQIIRAKENMVEEIKQKWVRIQVLRLFLEHVLPPGVDQGLNKNVLGKTKTV